MWYCYLLYNNKRSYVGISTNPWRRLEEHNSCKPPGAKSTRDGGYFMLWNIPGLADRSTASKIEGRLKSAKGVHKRWQKLKQLRNELGLAK